MVKFQSLFAFSEQEFYFVCPGLFHCYSRALNIYHTVMSCKRLNLQWKTGEAGAYIYVNVTFCTTPRDHRYSQHANSNGIDRDKQNKILVRRKRIMTET